MANLFWKNNKTIRSLIDTPFKTEEEFEKTIFSTPDLLKDIFLIKRQIRGGKKGGIPDIVGIDSDGTVCILELKNVPVDAGIIQQVLGYAIWAETNPDSIRALWLESVNKPDDFTPDWNSLEVRIIVLAPVIHQDTLQFVQRINYPIDLVEVKRWVHNENHLIMVNKLENHPRRGKVKPANGLPTYDDAYYQTYRNKESVRHFLRYADELEKLASKQRWAVERKFNRYSCVFKVGFFNAFSVRWIGTKTLAFSVGVTEKEATTLGPFRPTKYSHKRQRALYHLDPAKHKTKDFVKVFACSYKRLAGEQ